MHNHDGIPTMEYKLLCTTQDWSPLEGFLIWLVDEEDKVILLDRKPKPRKPIPMKNVKDIIKDISCFIQYWDSLRVMNVGGSLRHQYERWIGYWTRVRSTLMDLHQDSPLTLRHSFWPQSRVEVHVLEARFLKMGRFVRSSTRATIMLACL